jgi:hypothetical protein
MSSRACQEYCIKKAICFLWKYTGNTKVVTRHTEKCAYKLIETTWQVHEWGARMMVLETNEPKKFYPETTPE